MTWTSVAPGTSVGGLAARTTIIRLALAMPLLVTSSGEPAAAAGAFVIAQASRTDAGLPVAPAQDAATTLAELRRRSGLTWEQLGELFGVSRRSAHFWASGRPMSTEHLAHLYQVVEVVRRLDRGEPSATREALLAPLSGGPTPYALMTEGRFDACLASLASIAPASRPPRPRLAPEELARRRAVAPDVALATSWEPLHIERPGRKKVSTRRRTSEG